MNEKLNENECGKASEVKGMKNEDRIDRFERFKRLRYRPTDRPTDGHDLLQKCEDALKNDVKRKGRKPKLGNNVIPAGQRKYPGFFPFFPKLVLNSPNLLKMTIR